MDARQLENLSRRVGAEASRRGAILAVLAGVPVALGLRSEPAAAGIPIAHCKAPGKSCDKNKKCCSGRCRNGHCGCNKKGRPCWAPLEGALCCSRRCHSGKCA
jgi:hypothetical protein